MKRAIAITLLCLITLATASAQDRKDSEEPERPAVVKQIKKYLRENFGWPGDETSWYHDIKDVSVRGDTVVTRTDLADADEDARHICGAVSFFVFDRTHSSLNLNRVQIVGQGGKVLIDRNGIGEPCR